MHHLPGRGSVALVGSVECYRRGLHQFEEIVVESKAPFGLFRRRRRLTTSLSVLVYPQVFALEKIPLVEAIQGTQTRPQKTRVGQEIAGTRRYFPGDPPRHIHWRNTAREGRLMLKEFEDSQEDTLIIGFDSSADSGDGRETVLEYSIKLAASVAGYIAGRGGGVRLVTGGLTEGVEALRRRAGQLSGLAVVVLEGFEQAQSPNAKSALESLRNAGAAAVSCRRGELQEALRSLETAWSLPNGRRGDSYGLGASACKGADRDTA